jgi:hypothetical protein
MNFVANYADANLEILITSGSRSPERLGVVRPTANIAKCLARRFV